MAKLKFTKNTVSNINLHEGEFFCIQCGKYYKSPHIHTIYDNIIPRRAGFGPFIWNEPPLWRGVRVDVD